MPEWYVRISRSTTVVLQLYAPPRSCVVSPGTRSDSLFDGQVGSFAGTPDEALMAAAELESGAVATHAEILGALQSFNGAELIAAIQLAEARHCTVLAHLADSRDYAVLLVDKEAASLQVNG